MVSPRDDTCRIGGSSSLPRVRRVTFSSYTCRIYGQDSGWLFGLWRFWPPRPVLAASYAVRVPQAEECLQLLSDV